MEQVISRDDDVPSNGSLPRDRKSRKIKGTLSDDLTLANCHVIIEDMNVKAKTRSADSESVLKPPVKKKRLSSHNLHDSTRDIQHSPVVTAAALTNNLESQSKKPESCIVEPRVPTDTQNSAIICAQLQAISEKLSAIDAKLDSNRNLYIKSIADLKGTVLECVQDIKQLKKEKTRSPEVLAKSFPLLPLSSLQELHEFEEELEYKSKDLVEYLYLFGTPQISTSVHKMMKQVLKNEIAVLFSLKGTTKKRKFIDLKLCSCVRGK